MSKIEIDTSGHEKLSIKKCPTYSNKTKTKQIQPTHKPSHDLISVKNKLEEKSIIHQRKQR